VSEASSDITSVLICAAGATRAAPGSARPVAADPQPGASRPTAPSPRRAASAAVPCLRRIAWGSCRSSVVPWSATSRHEFARLCAASAWCSAASAAVASAPSAREPGVCGASPTAACPTAACSGATAAAGAAAAGPRQQLRTAAACACQRWCAAGDAAACGDTLGESSPRCQVNHTGHDVRLPVCTRTDALVLLVLVRLRTIWSMRKVRASAWRAHCNPPCRWIPPSSSPDRTTTLATGSNQAAATTSRLFRNTTTSSNSPVRRRSKLPRQLRANQQVWVRRPSSCCRCSALLKRYAKSCCCCCCLQSCRAVRKQRVLPKTYIESAAHRLLAVLLSDLRHAKAASLRNSATSQL